MLSVGVGWGAHPKGGGGLWAGRLCECTDSAESGKAGWGSFGLVFGLSWQEQPLEVERRGQGGRAGGAGRLNFHVESGSEG